MASGELSQTIKIIGQELRELRGKRVAIYLPNSVELLSTLFGELDVSQDILIYTVYYNPENQLSRYISQPVLSTASPSSCYRTVNRLTR